MIFNAKKGQKVFVVFTDKHDQSYGVATLSRDTNIAVDTAYVTYDGKDESQCRREFLHLDAASAIEHLLGVAKWRLEIQQEALGKLSLEVEKLGAALHDARSTPAP